jgi:hypothetical protein
MMASQAPHGDVVSPSSKLVYIIYIIYISPVTIDIPKVLVLVIETIN